MAKLAGNPESPFIRAKTVYQQYQYLECAKFLPKFGNRLLLLGHYVYFQLILKPAVVPSITMACVLPSIQMPERVWILSAVVWTSYLSSMRLRIDELDELSYCVLRYYIPCPSPAIAVSFDICRPTKIIHLVIYSP